MTSRLLIAGACTLTGCNADPAAQDPVAPPAAVPEPGGAPPPPPASDPPPPTPTGTPPVVQTDVFVQTSPGSVDLLWVVDTHGPCAGECVIDVVMDNAGAFLDALVDSGIDFHVGVVTSDTSDGKLLQSNGAKFVDILTVDPVGTFQGMLDAAGEADKSGAFGATYFALEVVVDTANAGFYRDDAVLHTAVVSDENDETPAAVITLNEVVGWYEDLKDPVGGTSFHAIVCTIESEVCPADAIGTEYIDAAALIGGTVVDLADVDEPLFEDLGYRFAGLLREFDLSKPPIVESLEVTVAEPDGDTLTFVEATGDPLVGDYTYDPVRNSITFLDYVPPTSAKVNLSYIVAYD
jgi:hypothetical protein